MNIDITHLFGDIHLIISDGADATVLVHMHIKINMKMNTTQHNAPRSFLLFPLRPPSVWWTHVEDSMALEGSHN